MYLLYSILFFVGILALLPYFLFQAIKNKKYVANFRERLGFLPLRRAGASQKSLWIHAVSVGEVLAIKPLVAGLRQRHPEYQLYVSVTTIPGQRVAEAKLGPMVDGVIYFPFDWNFAVKRALNALRPDAFIVAETEIWPNFLHACRRRGIRTALINGRISERSFQGYKRIRFFMRRVLSDIELFCMQTKEYAERISALGAAAQRVHVTGNLKYDLQDSGAAPDELCHRLRVALHLDDSTFLMIAGSTMPGEEVILISLFKTLKAEQPGLRMILAPRRPERFDEVARLLETAQVSYQRRRRMPGVAADVILLDTIGELAHIYELADLVFMGGSLAPYGGHNILEPALYAKPILFGPHMDNFRDIAGTFLAAAAAVQVESAEHLLSTVRALMADRDQRADLGQRARAIIERHRGVTERTLDLIETLLSGAGGWGPGAG